MILFLILGIVALPLCVWLRFSIISDYEKAMDALSRWCGGDY